MKRNNGHAVRLARSSTALSSTTRSALVLLAASLLLSGCDKSEVGDVSLGLFTTKDIKINVLQDPVVTGVTCHVASIEADLDFSDPSDTSISCRQTGPITAEMIAQIDRSASGEVIFRKSKSVLLKTLKTRRIFDASSQTLMYVTYSTKEVNGSYKHSLSTVPLHNTQAWQSAPTQQ